MANGHGPLICPRTSDKPQDHQMIQEPWYFREPLICPRIPDLICHLQDPRYAPEPLICKISTVPWYVPGRTLDMPYIGPQRFVSSIFDDTLSQKIRLYGTRCHSKKTVPHMCVCVVKGMPQDPWAPWQRRRRRRTNSSPPNRNLWTHHLDPFPCLCLFRKLDLSIALHIYLSLLTQMFLPPTYIYICLSLYVCLFPDICLAWIRHICLFP